MAKAGTDPEPRNRSRPLAETPTSTATRVLVDAIERVGRHLGVLASEAVQPFEQFGLYVRLTLRTQDIAPGLIHVFLEADRIGQVKMRIERLPAEEPSEASGALWAWEVGQWTTPLQVLSPLLCYLNHRIDYDEVVILKRQENSFPVVSLGDRVHPHHVEHLN